MRALSPQPAPFPPSAAQRRLWILRHGPLHTVFIFCSAEDEHRALHALGKRSAIAHAHLKLCLLQPRFPFLPASVALLSGHNVALESAEERGGPHPTQTERQSRALGVLAVGFSCFGLRAWVYLFLNLVTCKYFSPITHSMCRRIFLYTNLNSGSKQRQRPLRKCRSSRVPACLPTRVL